MSANTSRGSPSLRVNRFGLVEYELAWRAMQRYTDTRGPDSPDRIWLLQHPPVFTLGQAGRREHLLDPGDIPVIKVDRGGQVTYHGPGLCMAYLLLDLRRLGLGVRGLVDAIEAAVVALLAELGVTAYSRRDAPGVYVDDAKIAALGLRVRRGCSFHGLCLYVDGDLQAFERINPCGYAGLRVTRISDVASPAQGMAMRTIEDRLVEHLRVKLGYNPDTVFEDGPESWLTI